jgi:glycosyltransferase involved in cell wall biosynthesis
MHNILPHKYKVSDRVKAKWFYKKSDAVIFHSKIDVKRARELLNTNCQKSNIVIPHGNFNYSYKNNISKQNAREMLKISEKKKVILCFGFIRKNRGYEYLLKATENMDDVLIIIAGKTENRETYSMLKAYQKGNNQRVKLFAKWISDNDLQIYFNACDFVVLPYTQIYTSGVVPLAYSFRKPVITTNIGSMKEVVNEKTGLLIPPKDYKALRSAILKLLSMDYKKMGEFAFKFANKNFCWHENSVKIKNLYRTVLCK